VLAVSHLLREGAAAVRTELVTARSSWIEYESDSDLNVNLDGEPTLAKQFRVECRPRVLLVRLGESPLISSHQRRAQ
jgi:diacylglycerol kinase family enzyme